MMVDLKETSLRILTVKDLKNKRAGKKDSKLQLTTVANYFQNKAAKAGFKSW